MLSEIQCWILKTVFPGGRRSQANAYAGKSKLEILLGKEIFDHISGKCVVDFGCGDGTEAVEMAQRGARRVIGLDIREEVLRAARRKAAMAGVECRCVFATATAERADAIVSIDSFEHFDDPTGVLRTMNSLLRPDGQVFISFGPTWYHPLGGHFFSVFPWAHLLFSEEALIRWRSDFVTDGARHFGDVSGGLNRMTIGKFERLIAESPFQFSGLRLVPINKIRLLHNRLTRECTTAVVRCQLIKRRQDG